MEKYLRHFEINGTLSPGPILLSGDGEAVGLAGASLSPIYHNNGVIRCIMAPRPKSLSRNAPQSGGRTVLEIIAVTGMRILRCHIYPVSE